MQKTLIDAGPLIAYYNSGDAWHRPVQVFLEKFRGQFVTTEPVITEAMWMLSGSAKVQNELLKDLALKLFQLAPLVEADFKQIAKLNLKYSDVPADFADLSLVAVSERLEISDIVTLDSDFDIYRRLGRKKFNRIFPEH
ncbi:MAG: PIN domain-containing protein [Candidatus Melainabacteria bacterium]|nr:PIN domain-containing protein [Candidatus Melainabacteria bacterium]